MIKPVYAIQNPIIDNSQQWRANPEAFVNNVISSIVSFFIIIAILYFFANILHAGYLFILSKGDKNQVKEVQEKMSYSFIGIVVVFSVFALLKLLGFIFGITGLDTLQLTWPSF